MVPWLIAVLTLIPFYNFIFRYSRGLSLGSWTSYFHFTNDVISMSWLWFLPVLFAFQVLYALLRKLDLPTGRLNLAGAVAGVFVLGAGSSWVLGALGMLGWTKTVLADFQNERLLPYFLLFLLGAFCRRRGTLETGRRNMKAFATASATAWIPMNVYLIVLLNYFLRPGRPIVSELVDGIVLWVSLFLSMLGMLYILVTAFRYYFHRQGRMGATLGGLSYGVYIVHLAVMGPIALALLHTDLPTLAKYPILAASTYIVSNLVVYAYRRLVHYRKVHSNQGETTWPRASRADASASRCATG